MFLHDPLAHCIIHQVPGDTKTLPSLALDLLLDGLGVFLFFGQVGDGHHGSFPVESQCRGSADPRIGAGQDGGFALELVGAFVLNTMKSQKEREGGCSATEGRRKNREQGAHVIQLGLSLVRPDPIPNRAVRTTISAPSRLSTDHPEPASGDSLELGMLGARDILLPTRESGLVFNNVQELLPCRNVIPTVIKLNQIRSGRLLGGLVAHGESGLDLFLLFFAHLVKIPDCCGECPKDLVVVMRDSTGE